MSYDKSQRRKDLRKDHSLKTKFGINLPIYDKIFEDQNGACAICENTTNATLAVDHDHETGLVRGLLCSKCNQAIGLFGDNPDNLKRALKYLQEPRTITIEEDVERKPQDERARNRNIAFTPDGAFPSFTEAAKHYNVHPTTIGAWCGSESYLRRTSKSRVDEGFSYKTILCSEKQAIEICNENNDK